MEPRTYQDKGQARRDSFSLSQRKTPAQNVGDKASHSDSGLDEETPEVLLDPTRYGDWIKNGRAIDF